MLDTINLIQKIRWFLFKLHLIQNEQKGNYERIELNEKLLQELMLNTLRQIKSDFSFN